MRCRQDYPYLEALRYVMREGEDKPNRTGTDARSCFSIKMDWDLQLAFPLLTSKRVHWKSIINELLWFVRGETNIKSLHMRGCHIWDEWADKDGELGPVYGSQWRNWPSTKGDIDQLQECVDKLRFNPNDRRIVVSAWNVSDLPRMALAPCHMFYQFYVREDTYLDLQIYQRSCDMFLGVPFNIASYAALVHMIGHITALKPGELHWVGGDCHVYENHFKQVEIQLSRELIPTSPQLRISDNAPNSLDGGWTANHFIIEGYKPLSKIQGKVSI